MQSGPGNSLMGDLLWDAKMQQGLNKAAPIELSGYVSSSPEFEDPE
jgi:hypothetical protein